MAVPKLSKEALERLEQISKSRKMTPSQVILKLLPQPEPTQKSILKRAKRMTEKDAWAILEKPPTKPISEREANRIADEAVRKVRERRSKAR